MTTATTVSNSVNIIMITGTTATTVTVTTVTTITTTTAEKAGTTVTITTTATTVATVTTACRGISWHVSFWLRKQPTFCDLTTFFPVKFLRNYFRNFILMMHHYPELGRSSWKFVSTSEKHYPDMG